MNNQFKYLNSNMTPFDIIGKQMDFLHEQGRKIAITREEAEDQSVDIEIQRSLEADMEHDCHKSPEDGCEICDKEKRRMITIKEYYQE